MTSAPTADELANRPLVQESEFEDHVELVFPDQTIILGDEIAMAMFADCMRIVTGETPDDNA